MSPESTAPGQRRKPEYSGRDSTEVRARPLSVKRERAGLLWRLLPRPVRRKVAPHLEHSELADLNTAFRSYHSRTPGDRLRVELSLRTALQASHSGWPMVLSLLLGVLGTVLIGFHVARIPGMDALTRVSIFVPLLLGCLAPLSLYLVPRLRLGSLLRFSLTTEAAIAVFLCFLGLVWMLYFIGEGQAAFGRRPGGITFLVLCLGAITAPLLEEAFFRELIPSMFGRPPHIAGHGAAAVLFALAHVPSTSGMFGEYVVAGLFLATARIYSGGIVYPFLIHAAANLIHQTLF